MKVLLDTNVLLLRPQILAKKKEGVTLAVPFPVRLELALSAFTRAGVEEIGLLVDEAVRAGNVRIERLDRVPSLEKAARLSGTDIELITLAQDLKERGEEVILASEDRELAAVGQSVGIRCIGLSELEELLEEKTTTDPVIDEKAKAILTAQKKGLIRGSIGGVTFSFLANAFWSYYPYIVSKISVWGTSLLIIIIGVLAYALRGRFRLAYGVFEFIFGAIIGIRVFWPDFNYNQIDPIDFIQILAAIYVMVRGLDNTGKALQSTRFAPLWARLSGER